MTECNEKLNEKLKPGVVDGGQTAEMIRLYRRRWFILSMFMVYAIAAGLQWMQYSIITNIVVKYYDVEAYEVEWTTMLHMLAYVICILPALWILEKAGNRVTILIAGAGICIGAWIKFLAVQPFGFRFVLIGQAIEAAAQVLTFGLAGTVTATWFGPHEIAIGGSLALFGDQLGAGLGFMFPPLFVDNSDNPDDIGRGLRNLCLFIALLGTFIFIFMLIFFQDSPKKPPSHAQIVRNEMKKVNTTVNDFIKMVSKKSFLLMLLTYGIHIGAFNAHGTLLNRVFSYYFPDKEEHGGLIGCLIVLFGLLGSIVGGLFLDWKHLFKETCCSLYLGSTICVAGYTYALFSQNLVLVYVLASILGMFMWGYYSVALQFAIELVYPYSEGTAAGLALLSVEIISLVMTPIYRTVFENYNPFTANIFLVILLIIGTALSLKIPAKYRRQEAEKVLKAGESTRAFIMNNYCC